MQASARGASVTLEIAKSYADGAAHIKVIDHGAGMAPEVIERIRKPYFTTKEGGSGLGIAVARGIIERARRLAALRQLDRPRHHGHGRAAGVRQLCPGAQGQAPEPLLPRNGRESEGKPRGASRGSAVVGLAAHG